MLRAAIVLRDCLRSAGLVLWVGALAAPHIASAEAAPGDVTVQYRLMTEFAGPQKAGGRIVVMVTNRSANAFSKVTVRLADPGVGKLTGPVQESMRLAPGETRQLEGEFLFDTKVVNSAEPLQWIVVASEADGFAEQALVRGEVMQSASMDADSRTSQR